jgi:glycosyltransferase involved in cell wall biosynthesis
MSDAPEVSVVLPCFNAARFVEQSVSSLLGQTLAHMEIIAIDDGSTDATASILSERSRRDPRLRVLRNDANRGLIWTLNRGVAAARGRFIARMDADDVAAPGRLERQAQTLRDRADIDVLGSAVSVVHVHRRSWRGRRPALRCFEPGGARFMGLLGTPLPHMTLMARAEVMRDYAYGNGPQSLHTEDYELFSRMLAGGVRVANVPSRLVTVRVHPGAVSRQHEAVQVSNFVACSRLHLSTTLGIVAPDPVHRVLVNRLDGSVGRSDLRQGLELLDRVERIFLEREPGSDEEIRRIAQTQRVDILLQAVLRGSRQLKLAAAGLGPHYSRLLGSATTWRYLAAKL